MNAQNLSRLASANVDALAQIDLAAVAVRATSKGVPNPQIELIVADLMAIRDRVADRLDAVAAAMPG